MCKSIPGAPFKKYVHSLPAPDFSTSKREAPPDQRGLAGGGASSSARSSYWILFPVPQDLFWRTQPSTAARDAHGTFCSLNSHPILLYDRSRSKTCTR